MAITDGDISGVRNKIVRGQLLQRQKKEKAQNKLRKRIERKEAENRGEVVERGQFFLLSLGQQFFVLVLGLRVREGGEADFFWVCDRMDEND